MRAGERQAPFLAALRAAGFAGDVAADAASRTVYSTDNSIYQVEPVLVVFPRDGADIARLVRAAASTRMPVTARGGGTGTNGQSLTSGVIADVSRHMNRILSLDVAAMRVTVEPGVVLDQLNAALKPHGLFFPPTVSTASRATIGGMVATDASGKGSRIYGRTSDYIERLDVVLADGSEAEIGTLAGEALDTLLARQDRLGEAARTARRAVADHAGEIAARFPVMNRGLTGYNLQQMADASSALHLQKLLAGSEGTLAFTRAITLRLVKRPAARAIAVIRYGNFSAALGDIARLLGTDPAAIEIMDDKVLALAHEDVVWTTLETVLGGASSRPVMGLNVVEFSGSAEEVEAGLARLAGLQIPDSLDILDQTVVRDEAVVATVWDLRKKAVGLLGRLGGVPFIEDTAVPPENLPAYVKEFRTLLDSHGLEYGMFGHADVGCLHVRPVLDLRNPAHAALIRPLSDAVVALTLRFGGLLWGEHGRGFRGEYAPEFFGPDLYPVLGKIKAAFDPGNLFNPGKLAPAFPGAPIDRIDGVPFRGAQDRQIAPELSVRFEKAVSCNGNGACHGWDDFDLMCPSYKATRDRTQSPKGRAALLREWARRRSTGENADPGFVGFEDQVKASLDTCLGCKACAGLCPVKVDIPDMKAAFNAAYFATRKRPLRDRLLARLEGLLLLARHMPGLSNAVAGATPVRALLSSVFGLVDLPRFHPPKPVRARKAGGKRVILLEDLFTASFDGPVIDAAESLLRTLGYAVERAVPMRNGKALHALGFTPAFARVARHAMARVARLQQGGTPVLTLDAATGVMFADEYRKVCGHALSAPLRGIEEFLAAEIATGTLKPEMAGGAAPLTLLPHCTEKALHPTVARHWAAVFKAFGLEITTPSTGCCGMAGLFGHEKEHKSLSETLFRMSWQPILDKAGAAGVLATGFSCRCQTERFAGVRPRHPVEALLDHVSAVAHAAPAAARFSGK